MVPRNISTDWIRWCLASRNSATLDLQIDDLASSRQDLIGSDKPMHETQVFEHDPGAGTVEGDPGAGSNRAVMAVLEKVDVEVSVYQEAKTALLAAGDPPLVCWSRADIERAKVCVYCMCIQLF